MRDNGQFGMIASDSKVGYGQLDICCEVLPTDAICCRLRAVADGRLRLVVDKYQKRAPQLSAWLEANVPEALTVLTFPAIHRKRLRTSNLLERINKELRRRTRVATLCNGPRYLAS